MNKFKEGDLVKPYVNSFMVYGVVVGYFHDEWVLVKALAVSNGCVANVEGNVYRFMEHELNHYREEINYKPRRLNDDCTPMQEPTNPKASLHMVICNELTNTYEAKNADYGDSFAHLRNRLPNAILVRLFDKYLRLETLLQGAEAQVKDESIEDTLLDMANYCIMEVIERRAKE